MPAEKLFGEASNFWWYNKYDQEWFVKIEPLTRSSVIIFPRFPFDKEDLLVQRDPSIESEKYFYLW